MGQIIRLDTQFDNNNLKQLVDYDVSRLVSDITKIATLRAFYDCTDVSKMTIADGKVTQLNDISGNALHFVQSSTVLAPVYDQSALDGVGALRFSGAQSMLSNQLFSTSQTRTVVIFLRVGQDVTGTRIIMSAKSSANENFYKTQTNIKALGGALTTDITDANAKKIHYMCAYDAINKTATLYGDNKSSSTESMNYGVVSGGVYIGRWADGYDSSNNNFSGSIGHIMVFDEDLSKNDVVRRLLNEYVTRKY